MFKPIRAEELKVGQMFKRHSPEECTAPAKEILSVKPAGKLSVKIVAVGFPARAVRRETIVWVAE